MKSLRLFWMQYADFTRVSDRKDFWISQLWHLLFTSPFWMYELVRSSTTSNQTALTEQSQWFVVSCKNY